MITPTIRLATDNDMCAIDSRNLGDISRLPTLYITLRHLLPAETDPDAMKNWGVAHERTRADFARLYQEALVAPHSVGDRASREADPNKELFKRRRLMTALAPSQMALSRYLHAYLLIKGAGSLREAEVCPYIDMNQPAGHHTISGQKFLDDLVAEVKVGEEKFDPRQIRAYLDALGKGTDSESGTTGFIVMVDRKGTVRELPIDDFRELRLQIGTIREYRDKMQMVMERLEASAFEPTLAAADAKQRARELAKSRSRSGPSR